MILLDVGHPSEDGTPDLDVGRPSLKVELDARSCCGNGAGLEFGM